MTGERQPVLTDQRSGDRVVQVLKTHPGRGDVTAVLDTPALTAAERCDRCGAQAYVRALLPSGGELLFCAHHGREHAEKLREVSADILDESDRLVEPRPTA